MLIIIFTTLSCKKEQLPIETSKTLNTKDSIQVIDTLFVIDSLNFTNPKGSSTISKAIAQQILDEYYSAKGILNRETGFQDEETTQLCAYYDTIHKRNLNKDKHEDAIISYWLMPCLAAGHCYQPTYAIISKINGKPTLLSAEFIPESFYIDSISSDKKNNYLYLNKFDCGTDKIDSRYKAKIVLN